MFDPNLLARATAVGTVLGRARLLLGGGGLALALLALRYARNRALYGDEADVNRYRTCPSCGGRTVVEADACEDCGASLDASR